MAVAPGPEGRECGLVGRDVLVEPEEVVRIVLPLQRLELRVLLRPVRLPNALGTLVAQEVHVDPLVPRTEGVPEAAYPLPFFLEARTVLGAGADVVGEAGRAAGKGGLVVIDPADGAARLPDRVGRIGR